MTKQQAEEFISIYNALLTIATKGEDTKTMARVLTMMENLANSVQVVQDPPQITPQVEEDSVKGE